MWGVNNNYSNSFIWFILLILIFFKGSSSNTINEYDYFRLNSSTNGTRSLIDNNLNF